MPKPQVKSQPPLEQIICLMYSLDYLGHVCVVEEENRFREVIGFLWGIFFPTPSNQSCFAKSPRNRMKIH